jgi:hypothetical protein
MSKPVIREAPRTLPLMPAGQQATLDPYMALIVGYRKSGLSPTTSSAARWTAATVSGTSGATSRSRPRTCSAPTSRPWTC